MMTSTIRKFGVGVASLAMVASVAAPAFAADSDKDVLPGLGNATMERLWGADRIGTALKVADHAFQKKVMRTSNAWAVVARDSKPTTVYITNADDAHLIDSTTAGKLTDGPIVFVKNNSYVAEAVGAALKNSTDYPSFGAFNKVVAIGGQNSISDATLAAVAKKAGVAKTERIAGKDRYETAVKIAEYMYSKAMKNEDGYGYLLADSYFKDDGTVQLGTSTNLREVYIANGGDNHLVDSMVGGVLDYGPTLLSAPDGSLSEETQAFIKKTLPESFAALGGEKAVSDKTVNDAWLIKALKNDWTKSSDIPGLKNAKDKAEFLLNGASHGESRNPGDSDFMGLKKAVSVAVRVRDVWSTDYQRVRLDANEALARYLKNHNNLTPKQMVDAMRGVSGSLAQGSTDLQKFVANMILLYGDAITNADAAGTTTLNDLQKANLLKGAFSLQDGKVVGFDFGSFETYPAIADKVTDAKADLVDWWGRGKVDANHIPVKTDRDKLSYIAIASQKETVNDALNSKWNRNATILTPIAESTQKAAASAPLAAVKEVSAWVAEEVKKNRDAKQAEYEAAAQALREGLDKVAPKTVLRLGGKDRYETASYIATQYMKETTFTASRTGAQEFYVANGTAYADAIVAGQLRLGPVLLVPAEGDIPASVQSTAASLPAWNKGKALRGFAIGGTKVMPEAQAAKVLGIVNKGVTSTGEEKVDTIHADRMDVTVNGSTIANAASPTITVKFQVKDGKTNFSNAGSNKIEKIKVYNSDSNLNSAVSNQTATGTFDVTLDLTTAKTGNYTVEYTINGKTYKTNLGYQLGTAKDVVDTDTAAGNTVSYKIADDNTYDGGKVYEVKDTPAGKHLALVSDASVAASGTLTATSHDDKITDKTLVIMANGKPAKVVKTGQNLEKFATPTLGSEQSTVAHDGSEVELVTISNFSSLIGKMDSSNGNYLGNFDWEIVNSSPALANTSDVVITKIASDGKVYGKVTNPTDASKKFKIKLTVKAKGNQLASTPGTSADIETNS